MAAGTHIQKWGSYDTDEAEKDKKAVERKGIYFKIKNNKTQLRFLPPKRGQKNPFIKTWQHFVALVPGDDRTTVIFNCPKRMMQKPCALCAQAEKKFATGKKADQDRAYDLRAKLRVYAAIVDRDDEDKGVQTFAFGQTIFEQLINIRDDIDFTHPIDGCDITILRKGTGKRDTEYNVKAVRNNSALHEDAAKMDEWFDALPDLVQNAYVPTPEEVNAKMDEALNKADEDNSEERKPRRGSIDNEARRPAAARAPVANDNGGTIDTDGEAVDPGTELEPEAEEDDLWRR